MLCYGETTDYVWPLVEVTEAQTIGIISNFIQPNLYNVSSLSLISYPLCLVSMLHSFRVSDSVA